ncbi:hypothetical protein AD998_12545 [bacterium 336/3]|nr:hypothetical protein AD998_12545 [bacterium 336/3]
MKIDKKFNTFTYKEYFFYIDNHKRFTDFNTLGLYRSILENSKLSIDEKVEVREYAHQFFKKPFDFLQVKDPYIFVEISTLGQTLTKADKDQIWRNLRNNQKKILADKKIKHRNFGDYSKHNCGDENCFYNGLMIKQGSFFAEGGMHFYTDKRNNFFYPKKEKSLQQKKDRKKTKTIIAKELDYE